MKTDKIMNIIVLVSIFLVKAKRKTEQKVGILGLASIATGIIVIGAILASNLILLLIGLTLYLISLSYLTFQAYKNYRKGRQL